MPNAEGVHQFQPQVTPWVSESSGVLTLKELARVGHPSVFFLNWPTPSVFSLIHNYLPQVVTLGWNWCAFGVKEPAQTDPVPGNPLAIAHGSV